MKGEYHDQPPWHQKTARKSGVVSRRRYVFLIIQCGASLAEATTGDPSAPCLVEIVGGKAWKKWRWKTLCPGVDTHTHTHTPPQGEARKTKVRANVHVCTLQGQKDEDTKRRQDRTKRYVVAMKGEPSAQGQPMNPASLSRPGRPET